VGDWSGTVPSHTAGATSRASKLQTLDDIETALTGAWTAWTPTLTNLTLGTGTVVARYRRLGKTLDYKFIFTYGAGSAVGTSPTFSLPYTMYSGYSMADPLGDVILLDSGTATRRGSTRWASSTTLEILSYSTTGILTTVTATVPQTWAAGDTMSCAGTLELA